MASPISRPGTTLQYVLTSILRIPHNPCLETPVDPPRPPPSNSRGTLRGSYPFDDHCVLLTALYTRRCIAADIVAILEECSVPWGSGTVFAVLQLWAIGHRHYPQRTSFAMAAGAIAAVCKVSHRWPNAEVICGTPTGVRHRLTSHEVVASEGVLLTLVRYRMPSSPLWSLSSAIALSFDAAPKDLTRIASVWLLCLLQGENDPCRAILWRSGKGPRELVGVCCAVVACVQQMEPSMVVSCCAGHTYRPWIAKSMSETMPLVSSALRLMVNAAPISTPQ